MALSQDIKMQFAKTVTPKRVSQETTVEGTFKTINGKEYVQLDGSDILTPVKSTVSAETGDRVKVLIKEHEATVNGNITSPSARSKDLDNIKDEVDEYGNTIKRLDTNIQQQETSIIQMQTNINQHEVTINQHQTTIQQQGDNIVSINNDLLLKGNEISAINTDLALQGSKIESMDDTIKSHGNSITEFNNTIVEVNNKVQSYDNKIEQMGNQITEFNNTITSIDNKVQSYDNQIVSINNNINAANNNITILGSAFKIVDGKLTGLSDIVTDNLKTTVLNSEYAQIDFSNIGMAAVGKLFTESGIIKDLVVNDTNITGELVGVTIKGDIIEGNTIYADKLVILGDDGLYYKLNTAGADGNTIGPDGIVIEQTNKNSLDGRVITAKTITAEKVNVSDLVAFGATIGGFDITNASINTYAKEDVNSPLDGIYLGSDGQMAIGNDEHHIKYYKDENGHYILDVRLDKLYLGTSEKTAEEQFTGMVELSAKGLTTVFKTSGGSNLLRNSVGYNGTNFWSASGVIKTKQDDSMSLSGSSFVLTGNNSIVYIEQYYKTIINEKYSVAFKYKHSGAKNRIKVEIFENDSLVKEALNTIELNSDWISVELDEPYIAKSIDPKIRISVSGDDTFEITDLIISQGTNNVWSCHADELYGTNHQLDRFGLRLKSENSNNSSDTTSTYYQLKNGSIIDAELKKERVLSDSGEFRNSYSIGRLKTILLDNNNVIEYI